MKYCPKCGKALVENSAFCLYCGEDIRNAAESPTKKRSTAKSRKKIVISCSAIVVIALLALIGIGLQMHPPKKLSPETNFLFSAYSGIQPIETTSDFPDAKGEVIQETYSGKTNWDLINSYCQDLENYGFKKEDLSYKFEGDAIWYKFSKKENSQTGTNCSYTIFIRNVPIVDGDNIVVQVQTES